LSRLWTTNVAAGRSFALERLQALLKIGADTRQALSDLDINLAARALLATGEDAVRTILVSSNDITPQRDTDFLRDFTPQRYSCGCQRRAGPAWRSDHATDGQSSVASAPEAAVERASFSCRVSPLTP
jgi:hypothetical protein